jgi:hypothetical protein
MDLQSKVEALATELRTRASSATGADATRLQALEQRLTGGGGGRGRGAGGGGGGQGGQVPVQPLRARLNTLINAFVGSGARTGTLTAPTGVMRDALAEAKADFAAVQSEAKR